jgi:hypothetical protein
MFDVVVAFKRIGFGFGEKTADFTFDKSYDYLMAS